MKVFGCGNNDPKLLGDDSDGRKLHELSFLTDGITHICLGEYQMVVTNIKGKVYAAGNNNNGLICDKERVSLKVPTKLHVGKRVKMAAAGYEFTLYMTLKGDLIMYTSQDPGHAHRFTLPEPAAFIFSFDDFPGVIDTKGSFYFFFTEDSGLFSHVNINKPPKKFTLPRPAVDLAVSSEHIHVLTDDGNIYTSDSIDINSCSFEINESLMGKKIKQISGNQSHCLALTFDGEVFACGDNTYGQLGDGTTESYYDTFTRIDTLTGKGVKQVSAGGKHSLFLTKDGKVLSCGSNKEGQLILDGVNECQVPTETKIKLEASCIIAGYDCSLIIIGGEIPQNLCLCPEEAQLSLIQEESQQASDEQLTPEEALAKLTVDNKNLKAENVILIDENKHLKKRNNKSKKENRTLKDQIEEMQGEIILQKKRIERLIVENHGLKKKILKLAGKERYKEGNEGLSDFIIHPQQYEVIRKIGQGKGGDVYQVVKKDTQISYAKKEYAYEFEEEDTKDFMRRCEIFGFVNHPCVISFKGFFLPTINEPAALYFEYAELGTLQDVLENPPPEWDSTRKTICVLEIVFGMKYLHSLNIIHRDLNPTNILCTKRYHFKISSFNDMIDGAVTKYFTAPEVFSGSEFDTKSDVFAFGIVLYMIMTNTLPKVSQKKFLNGKRAKIPQTINQFVSDLIEACWAQNPIDRPSFAKIIDSLADNDFMLFDDVETLWIQDRFEQLSVE